MKYIEADSIFLPCFFRFKEEKKIKQANNLQFNNQDPANKQKKKADINNQIMKQKYKTDEIKSIK